MSRSRLETRVGAFVLIGLVLLAALLLMFSKGMTFSGAKFELRLRSANVGGIKTGANVLLAGVPVGRVSGVALDEDGKAVTIFLSIAKRYRVYSDAQFDIEQAGFLGDQYISIQPGVNLGEPLTNRAVVYCQTPFNMQEALAQAVETISRIGQATTNVNAAVDDMRRLVLSEQRLTNLGESLDRFNLLTADALNAVSNVNVLLSVNALPVTVAVSNLSHFSTQLSPLATNVNVWLTTNQDRITAILQNFESGSMLLSNLLHGLDAGEGAAGRLLRDEQMAADLSAVARNLATTTSNLNQRGLWSILWRQKDARTNPPPARGVSSPRDPFR